MGRPKASGSRKRKAQDPNKPKRSTSAYFYYMANQRAELEKQGKKITRVAEWTKEVSAKWRNLQPKEKEQFEKLAAKDKARYDAQMAIYKGKDKDKPKRPQSAYFLWLADFRVKMKGKYSENKDLLRAAGEEWKKLTQADKAPYEKGAEEERRKYEQAMREYNQKSAAKKQKVEEDAANGAEDEEDDEEEEEDDDEEEEDEEDDE